MEGLAFIHQGIAEKCGQIISTQKYRNNHGTLERIASFLLILRNMAASGLTSQRK